ncbi:helix-turn-helix domain-containing protein [Amycolatopsis sp. GM8]|uniref:IclR family transcriptional regulator domain-containing protein n=1 Tax=Amycolatopsis sp. GM8 TaxID=2896530 RepID=UPI002104B95E|nr:helix-turn-helix domain-containing protein [Amycolatopsis sp. GM8]
MTDTPAVRRGPHFVRSAARAFSVLLAFDSRSGLTLAEIARKTALDGSTARRLLLTLADLGYVRSDGKAYHLTPRTLEFGFAYLSTIALPGVAQPHLQALAHALGETTTLAVLDGEDVFQLAVVAGFRRHATTVGTRLSAWTSASGFVLLAALADDDLERRLGIRPNQTELRDELKQVRARGWALLDSGVAAPIRNRQGNVITAIEVGGGLTPGIAAHEDVPELIRTARAIESDLAQHPE